MNFMNMANRVTKPKLVLLNAPPPPQINHDAFWKFDKGHHTECHTPQRLADVAIEV